jgi:hypothetical protein
MGRIRVGNGVSLCSVCSDLLGLSSAPARVPVPFLATSEHLALLSLAVPWQYHVPPLSTPTLEGPGPPLLSHRPCHLDRASRPAHRYLFVSSKGGYTYLNISRLPCVTKCVLLPFSCMFIPPFALIMDPQAEATGNKLCDAIIGLLNLRIVIDCHCLRLEVRLYAERTRHTFPYRNILALIIR